MTAGQGVNGAFPGPSGSGHAGPETRFNHHCKFLPANTAASSAAAAFSPSFLESYFKSTRRKAVCQKQVRSSAIAAGRLAAKN
jgi:hypothetical protein